MSSRHGHQVDTTVDNNLQVTTREQALGLDKAFDDVFGPLSGNTPEPPEHKEPPTGDDGKVPPEPTKTEPDSSPETKKTTETPTPEPKSTEAKPTETPKPVEIKTVTPDPDEEDPELAKELENLQLHPDSRPDTVHVVRTLRKMLNTRTKDAKALRSQIAEKDQQIAKFSGEVRPVSDPEVQRELTSLREFQTKHQIFDDSIYQTQFEGPVHQSFDDILKDVVGIAADKEAAKIWEEELRKLGPDKLDREYWTKGVIETCTDPLHRDRLVRKVNSLLDAQQKRNEFRQTMQDPVNYAKFRTEQQAEYWKRFEADASDEAKKIIPTLGEWASPKQLELAKTAQEREAWETHNKTYQVHEDRFKTYLTEVATQGPRGMTRVCAIAVAGEKAKEDLAAAETKISKLQAELSAAQDELNKIAGARSRVSSGSSGGTSTAPPKQKSRLGMTAEEAVQAEFGNR